MSGALVVRAPMVAGDLEVGRSSYEAAGPATTRVDVCGGPVSHEQVPRRRVHPIGAGPTGWVAADLVLDPAQGVAASFDPDRTWCLPHSANRPTVSWLDPIWRSLDRWSRAGPAVVRFGAPDVYRIIRLPTPVVRASIGGWAAETLSAGRSSLEVSSHGQTTLRGVFRPNGRRPSAVEIGFEPWSAHELCAHLAPVGPSSRRIGSTAWWKAAHEVLDVLIERLECPRASAPQPRSVEGDGVLGRPSYFDRGRPTQ